MQSSRYKNKAQTHNRTSKPKRSLSLSSHKKKHNTTSKQSRSVSFLNAKFQIVQVKVQKQLPKLALLPPPIDATTTPLDHDHHDENEHGSDHEHDDSINYPGHSRQRQSKRPYSSSFTPPTPHISQQQFLSPSILSNSSQLLEFALKQPKGTTFMVRKNDLEEFYKTSHQLLLEQKQQKQQNQSTNTLLLPSLNSLSSSDGNSTSDDDLTQRQISAQLELFHQEQQIALQSAPKVKIQELADEENVRRREFYNSTNAKPLKLFRLPRKHEIQAIIATSKGDLNTVKQIFAKAYHDCLVAMHLLPKRFVQKTTLNPQDWAEITDQDVNILYSPERYRFFQNTAVMDEFFTWLEKSFSIETLHSFRSSALYDYNIGAQLQKGGGVLHHAAQHGNLDILQFALVHGGKEHINQLTSNNSTPLHWACGSGWLQIVKTLIENGADIHACTNSWGVDVFGRDSGQLPLQWAASSGHGHIVEYLYLLAPLTIGIKDEKDNTVRNSAQKGLHFDTIRKIDKMVKDEYVPIQLDIHTVEQNMIFDHTQFQQFKKDQQMKKEQQQQQNESGEHYDVDHEAGRADIIDIEVGERTQVQQQHSHAP